MAMGYQETIDQLSYFAPVEAFRHHLPSPDPERIAQGIKENWEGCAGEDWSPLDERALEDYAERLSERLKEL